MFVSPGGEVVGAFVGLHEGGCVSDCSPERGDCSSGGFFEEGLQLGKGHLDGIEVWAAGRQEPQLGSGSLDGGADSGGFVSREVIHHHDVARGERGHENLLDISEESLARHRSVQHHRRRQAADESGRIQCPCGTGALQR